eukprot:3439762-Alexandrium_andersonii.AAC.1
MMQAAREAGMVVTDTHCGHGIPHFSGANVAQTWKCTVQVVEDEAYVLDTQASKAGKQARRLRYVADSVRVCKTFKPGDWPENVRQAWDRAIQ